MKELILMTAAFRIDNLKQSYFSIKECFGDITDVHITWLICYDQYNAYGDLNQIIELCKKGCSEFGMGWLVYNTGIEGQPNYGGDMYNEALKWIKENWFKNSDPWVYIFDDDNIIHPSMAKNFAHMVDTCEKNKKNIIILTLSHELGGIAPIVEDNLFAYHTRKNGERFCAPSTLVDPSQILMKYSVIDAFGFYNSTFEYDRQLWYYIECHSDEILFPYDWLNNTNGTITSQIQSFHNGQTPKETFQELDSIDDKSFILISQGNGINEPFCKRMVLPKEIGEECYRKVKNYTKEKQYIKDDRIFKNIDKIYILTQVNTPNRWDFVIKQFKKLGVYDEIADKIELVKGVKIPGLNENVIETIAKEGLGNPLYNAEMSYSVPFFNCTNEHYRILNQAIAEDYDTIMIIEDDACFTKNLGALKRALDTIPTDFNILHLEGFISKRNEESIVKRVTENLDKTIEEATWKPYLFFHTWASACIIYSRNGMRQYVQEQKKYIIGVDNRLGAIIDKCYMYSFPLVRQEDRRLLSSGIEHNIIHDSANLYLLYSNKQDYFSMFES